MRSTVLNVPDLPKAEWRRLAKEYRVDHKEEALIRLACASGERGHLSRDEFLKIASWKSPRPKRFHGLNSDDDVPVVTARAFTAKTDVEKILLLTELNGVNVRTASAILHLCFPTLYPLLDYRAIAAFGVDESQSRKWDELHWLRLWPAYITTCRHLAATSGLPLRDVDRALWIKGGSNSEPGN